YELLKTWTMPTEARRSLRLAAAVLPTEAPPAAFGKFPLPASGVACSAQLLIDAALEIGKIDEVAKELEQCVKDKVENAETVSLLADLARGQGAVKKAE